MEYRPQRITKELLQKVAKAAPPTAPREIRDRARGVVLRHQPSGYMALYVQLGRGKRERICNARDIVDERNELTLGKALQKARILHGDAANGRDFAGERKAQQAIPTLKAYLNDTYEPWALANRRSGAAMVARVRACFEKKFGNRRLTEITPAKVATWAAKRREAGTIPETVNRDISALRACLSRAVKLRVIDNNPLAGIELNEVDRNKQSVIALTTDQKQALVQALKARDDEKRRQRASANRWREQRGRKLLPQIGRFADTLTPAVIVSLETGLRRSELFSLEWPSVDLDERTLRVKGATAKSYLTRDIPLNNVAHETLRDWWLQRGQPKGGYVFTADGERLKNLKKSYHAVLADAGIERVNAKGERINWHSLRHTFGSLLGAASVDPTTLKKLMGHANLSTTQRYLHSDRDRQRNAVERLHG